MTRSCRSFTFGCAPIPRYVWASYLASTGGTLYGIDTGIIGPVTVMDSWRNQFGYNSPIVHGIVVSSILLSAAVTSFYAGRPADRFGRPKAIAFGAIISTIGLVVEASSTNLAGFLTGRVIEGLGEGLFIGPSVTYICEISPPSQRGPLTTLVQFGTCFGLVIGYFIAYGTDYIPNSLSWRLPFIILAALNALWAITLLLMLPASPRWLVMRHRLSEVDAAWDKLQVKQEDRNEALEEIMEVEGNTPSTSTIVSQETPEQKREIDNEIEKAEGEPSNTVQAQVMASKRYSGWWDILSPDVRRRTLLGTSLMGALQLCGIDAVLYYAPLLFQRAGLESSQSSFFASGISGIVILVVSVPALLYADKWGRRASAILGGIGLTLTMYSMGAVYAAGASRGPARWVVIICIYLYSVVFATTWAVSIKVYATEIQPQRTRARATSVGHGVNWICNFTVALICPVLLDRSESMTYFLFGSFALATVVICYIWMTETKGRSLDEIERAFAKEHCGKPAKDQISVKVLCAGWAGR